MRFTELICYLGKGESSCIAMAKQRKMTVVTDDKAARNTCRQLNVPVTGTIGILKSSCIDHQLSVQDADSILAKMIGNGYYAPVQRISDIV